jgi:UDP-N-acetylglucosamine/UDP-N-acetylgalactosamine diphosphorylase
MDTDLHSTMQILKKYNQEQLLNFYNELTNDEKQKLLSQINSIDFDMVNTLYEQSHLDKSISFNRITPIPYIEKSRLTSSQIKKYTQVGNNIIKNNELAVITLAGGQGTRLGYKGPKGSYEIDVPPRKSLFEFACDNLKEVQKTYGISINWYIMTSPSNDLATKNFFYAKDFFNYPKDKIKFFTQDVCPIIDENGKIILENLYTIKTGSNGNGDVFRAFSRAGLIKDLDDNNIKWIFISGIDNILQKLADPIFLGLAVQNNYLIASKTIAKHDINDPEWVFANVDGLPSIISPNNIPNSVLQNANDSPMPYNQKNILAHLFTTEAFKKLINENLPYHMAFKKNDFINAEGMKEVPIRPNSFKFEKFIFDAFKLFDKLLLFEVSESEEFAPIKAFTGDATPETALELYKKYHNIL